MAAGKIMAGWREAVSGKADISPLTAAILDRITHHAMILNINGKSFRRML